MFMPETIMLYVNYAVCQKQNPTDLKHDRRCTVPTLIGYLWMICHHFLILFTLVNRFYFLTGNGNELKIKVNKATAGDRV